MSPIFLDDEEKGRFCEMCGIAIDMGEEEWPDELCPDCLKAYEDAEEFGRFLDMLDEDALDKL